MDEESQCDTNMMSLGTMVTDAATPDSSSSSTSNKNKSYSSRSHPCHAGQEHVHQFLRVVRSHAMIWAVPLFMFVALSISGMTIVTMHFDNEESRLQEEAAAIAQETGQRFSNFLNMAITPLFSLAQFVHELDEFRDLPNQIGPWNGIDYTATGTPTQLKFSLPMADNNTSTKLRNVTGVCDEPHLTERFHDIAATIKDNAQRQTHNTHTSQNINHTNSSRGSALVNLQLVPEGVVCLVHPLINTEDFPNGTALDSRGAIGHDLIADPQRRFFAEESLQSGDLAIIGPVPLLQCQDCDPVVEQAFIARLPIVMDGHTITTHDGRVLQRRWGFAVALINWQKLVEQTDLYHEFAVRNMGFQLIKRDQEYNTTTDEYIEKQVVLAETADFAPKKSCNRHSVVESHLDTVTDNEWSIQVVYSLEDGPKWRALATAMIVVVSALLSSLTLVVLFQKQIHAELVHANMLRAQLSARAERDLNDFIAHEVRDITLFLVVCLLEQDPYPSGEHDPSDVCN